ncbi:unnamed protein product [Prorocentrum cordatum]|uniref:Uncharacterized protein n=1 Tax=Prorocentrum cordatum TaxID=2364126 RepID=A0ABN9QTZ0_9DINO|nr:unnamed protein product [Polarella glacialis]
MAGQTPRAEWIHIKSLRTPPPQWMEDHPGLKRNGWDERALEKLAGGKQASDDDGGEKEGACKLYVANEYSKTEALKLAWIHPQTKQASDVTEVAPGGEATLDSFVGHEFTVAHGEEKSKPFTCQKGKNRFRVGANLVVSLASKSELNVIICTAQLFGTRGAAAAAKAAAAKAAKGAGAAAGGAEAEAAGGAGGASGSGAAAAASAAANGSGEQAEKRRRVDGGSPPAMGRGGGVAKAWNADLRAQEAQWSAAEPSPPADEVWASRGLVVRIIGAGADLKDFFGVEGVVLEVDAASGLCKVKARASGKSHVLPGVHLEDLETRVSRDCKEVRVVRGPGKGAVLPLIARDAKRNVARVRRGRAPRPRCGSTTSASSWSESPARPQPGPGAAQARGARRQSLAGACAGSLGPQSGGLLDEAGPPRLRRRQTRTRTPLARRASRSCAGTTPARPALSMPLSMGGRQGSMPARCAHFPAPRSRCVPFASLSRSAPHDGQSLLAAAPARRLSRVGRATRLCTMAEGRPAVPCCIG